MRNMKKLVLIIVTVFFAGASFSQSIDEGKRFLYNERYQSAKNVFQKLVTANPDDEAAAYYYGQSLIGLEDVAGAKAFYLERLSVYPNRPLLLAGIGHTELLEVKTQDARNRFETAVSLSGGKRIDVLNAVGAPNSDPEIKNGDAAYAIAKLRQATAIKGFKDPEVWANLGDAYRKNNDGGAAIQSYDAALALNPNYARAIYRKGRLYQTQGYGQEALYMRFYNEAIAKDAAYAPVYSTLFNYYYETNVPKSAEYLEKWLGASDNDPKACYYRASMKYAQGLFADAITKADECITTGGNSVYPNLYGVKALAYNRLGDSMQAKTSYEEYFKKQIPEKVGAGDYSSYATILLKFPGNEQQAAMYVNKAIQLDSTEANRVTYLKALGNAYRNQKNYGESARWYNKVLDIKKNYSNVDLYNAGYDYFRAGVFDSSVLVFNKYTVKYPDDIFGYYMIAKANSGIDTTRTSGLAFNSYTKAIEVGERAADKTKVKDQLVGSYIFMSQYFFEVKKDKSSAMSYVDKALAIDPANSTAVALKDFIMKNDPNARVAPVKPATPAKVVPAKTPAKPKAPPAKKVVVKKK